MADIIFKTSVRLYIYLDDIVITAVTESDLIKFLVLFIQVIFRDL